MVQCVFCASRSYATPFQPARVLQIKRLLKIYGFCFSLQTNTTAIYFEHYNSIDSVVTIRNPNLLGHGARPLITPSMSRHIDIGAEPFERTERLTVRLKRELKTYMRMIRHRNYFFYRIAQVFDPIELEKSAFCRRFRIKYEIFGIMYHYYTQASKHLSFFRL